MRLEIGEGCVGICGLVDRGYRTKDCSHGCVLMGLSGDRGVRDQWDTVSSERIS